MVKGSRVNRVLASGCSLQAPTYPQQEVVWCFSWIDWVKPVTSVVFWSVSLSAVQPQHILLQICLICITRQKGTKFILICLYHSIVCAKATQRKRPNIFVWAKACYSCWVLLHANCKLPTVTSVKMSLRAGRPRHDLTNTLLSACLACLYTEKDDGHKYTVELNKSHRCYNPLFISFILKVQPRNWCFMVQPVQNPSFKCAAWWFLWFPNIISAQFLGVSSQYWEILLSKSPRRNLNCNSEKKLQFPIRVSLLYVLTQQ